MADATRPVAATSRIIPLIMNKLLIFMLHFARIERADSVAEFDKGGYCAADTPRKRSARGAL